MKVIAYDIYKILSPDLAYVDKFAKENKDEHFTNKNCIRTDSTHD